MAPVFSAATMSIGVSTGVGILGCWVDSLRRDPSFLAACFFSPLSVMVSGNLCWAHGLGDNGLGAPGEYVEMNPFTGRSLLLGVKAFDVARSRDGGILAVCLEEVSEENQTHEYVSMARMAPGSANWSYSRICELSLPWATPVTRPSLHHEDTSWGSIQKTHPALTKTWTDLHSPPLRKPCSLHTIRPTLHAPHVRDSLVGVQCRSR